MKNNSILVVCLILLVALLPAWLSANRLKLLSSGEEYINPDPDSMFYYRIVDQAYEKGSAKYLDYDNYGNFPHLFKIGYPRFYFWLLYGVKSICVKLCPSDPDFLLGFFPVLTTSLTVIIIFISLWYLGYPSVFLLLSAFMLLPSLPSLSVGTFGKWDYDHILSLYLWLWILGGMFYQDKPNRKILLFGGLVGGLLFGSWIGSLLIFFVIVLVCFLLWLLNSQLCSNYLTYCWKTFLMATVINLIVVLCSLNSYGWLMLDFGLIHILYLFLASLFIFGLSKLNSENKTKIICFTVIIIILCFFVAVNSEDSFNLLEKISGQDPVYLDINELQSIIEVRKLFSGQVSIEKSLNYYGLFFFLFPIFLFIPSDRLLNRKSALILQIWLAVFAIATSVQNRYIRSLGAGSLLFVAFILYFLWKGFVGFCKKYKLSLARPAFAFILLLLLVRVSAIWGFQKNDVSLRKSDIEAYKWIKDNTPTTSGYSDTKQAEYGILAYWDLGHHIAAYAKRPSIANNMQNGVKNMADIFSSKNESRAYALCKELGVKYILMNPDRVLFPSSIDFWEEYSKQERKAGYTALSSKVERSKNYENWFYYWLNRAFTLKPRGEFGVSENFRIVYVNREEDSSTYSNMLFEAVEGAKLCLTAKANTKARVSLNLKIGEAFCSYSKEQVVSESGKICFTLPYSCYYNNGSVSTGEFYEVSLVSHETGKLISGKVNVREAEVSAGKRVATSGIIIFN